MNGVEVDLPSLQRVPGMFERLSESAGACRNYASEAFTGTSGGMTSSVTGAIPGVPAIDLGKGGIINYLAGTHSQIGRDVLGYFHGVARFAADQGEKVQDAAELYATTDRELAATLDQTLFDQPTQDAVREIGGRSGGIDLGAPALQVGGGSDPAELLLPPADYNPYEPDWKLPLKPEFSDGLSATGLARDLIWHATSFAARFGLCEPYDIINELVVPFTGDWAALKTCGDALDNLHRAAGAMKGDTAWIADWINAIWHGNAADACWLHVRKLELSLQGAGASGTTGVLKLYADAYHEVVDEIQRLQRIAETAAIELIDLATLFVSGPIGWAYTAWSLINPPDKLLQLVKLVFELLDIVKLAIQATWNFNARCELGMLTLPDGLALPEVPEASVGYR